MSVGGAFDNKLANRSFPIHVLWSSCYPFSFMITSLQRAQGLKFSDDICNETVRSLSGNGGKDILLRQPVSEPGRLSDIFNKTS